MGVDDHREAAQHVAGLAVAALTVSDTRSAADDVSGLIIQETAVAAGHRVAHYAILKNDPLAVRAEVTRLVTGDDRADVVVTTGGTGISPRDLTIEALRPLFQKEIEGFGDLFRLVSYHDVGTAALLSRATAGTVGRSLVFCLPGSQAAVRLAMEKLILPEMRHLISQLRKS